MIAHDMHMHPQIIKGAERFDAFADVAIQKGIKKVCITDHMPLIGSTLSDRIPEGKVKEYCRIGKAIKEKYDGILEVKLGIEVDWHPTIRDQVEEVLSQGEFDFIIGSSHLHAIKTIPFFDGHLTQDDYIELMLENTVSAAESGYFDSIAHIDMYKWIFLKPDRFPMKTSSHDERTHESSIKQTLGAIKDNGLLMEVNSHLTLMEGGELYPSEYITSLAKEMGLDFYFGSDAHKPEEVGTQIDYVRNHPLYSGVIK